MEDGNRKRKKPSGCCNSRTARRVSENTDCRGLIKTERTTIITQDGRKQNGSLLYTLLPIQFSIQQFYEQKLAKLDTECEQERIRKRLEALQQARQKTTYPPA